MRARRPAAGLLRGIERCGLWARAGAERLTSRAGRMDKSPRIRRGSGALERRASQLRSSLDRIEGAGGKVPSKDVCALVIALSFAFCCASQAAGWSSAEAPTRSGELFGERGWIDAYQCFLALAEWVAELWSAAGGGPEQARALFQALGAGSLAWAARGVYRRWRWRDLQAAGPMDVDPLKEELAWIESQLERRALDKSAGKGSASGGRSARRL